MTLRVEISIVPFGEENEKRIIHTLNISNISFNPGDNCQYGVEIDKYKTEDYAVIVDHRRSSGALKLVHGVFEALFSKESQVARKKSRMLENCLRS